MYDTRSLAAILLVACSAESTPRTTLRLEDYDRSCTVASDCTPASVGSYCPCTPCANAAINKSERAKYDADVAEVDCQGHTALCSPCPPVPATDCVAGLCRLVQ